MPRSRAVLTADGVSVQLSLGARLLGIHFARTLRISSDEIVGIWRSDALHVGRQLRWKIAGTALTRQRAMGWFSRPGHRGRWAWVWLTPGRQVVVIETRRARRALVALPLDWFDDASLTRIPHDAWPV